MRNNLSQFLAPFFSILILLLIPNIVVAHGGRTDANGGHNDRKHGGYHYHNSGGNRQAVDSKPVYTQSTPSDSNYKANNPEPESKSSIGNTNKDAWIYGYFRAANEGVGALDCDVRPIERDVSQSTKDQVLKRDGHRCVICGSTTKLEVDHKRGLQNGGDNSVNNLATLCDDCHTIKTRLDGSLRRKREKSCRK